MSSKKGPSLDITYSCENCEYYSFKANPPPSGSISYCNKLEKQLKYINTPDNDCPFKIINAQNFHKNEIERLKIEEKEKYAKLTKFIFPHIREISFNNYSSNIYTIDIYTNRFDSDIISKINSLMPDWTFVIERGWTDLKITLTLNKE